MIAEREADHLAEQLIARCAESQQVEPGTLTLHADRGASMRSKIVAELLVDLKITKSHSRPHVSDDNPYSESQFKTMKYRPDFPARFGSIEDARAHCQAFFHWYNRIHRHCGIGYMAPHSVHTGKADALTRLRAPPWMPPSWPTRSDSGVEPRPLRACQPPPGSTRHEGGHNQPASADLLSKLMTPGVAKSLTRSGPWRRTGRAYRRGRPVRWRPSD